MLSNKSSLAQLGRQSRSLLHLPLPNTTKPDDFSLEPRKYRRSESDLLEAAGRSQSQTQPQPVASKRRSRFSRLSKLIPSFRTSQAADPTPTQTVDRPPPRPSIQPPSVPSSSALSSSSDSGLSPKNASPSVAPVDNAAASNMLSSNPYHSNKNDTSLDLLREPAFPPTATQTPVDDRFDLFSNQPALAAAAAAATATPIATSFTPSFDQPPRPPPSQSPPPIPELAGSIDAAGPDVVGWRNLAASPEMGSRPESRSGSSPGSRPESPASRSMTPNQQALSQPESGRSTPVRPPRPDIHLTRANPSPDVADKRVAPRTSLQLVGNQKLRVVARDERPSSSSSLSSGQGSRSSSARPPTTRPTEEGPQPQQSSTVSLGGNGPVSQFGALESSVTKKAHKVRKGLFHGRSRSSSHDTPRIRNTAAWVISDDSAADYNTQLLTAGDKVPELWNDSSNVYVYMFQPESERGPSFKVPIYILMSSAFFVRQMRGQLSEEVDGPREYWVHVPSNDAATEALPLERLVNIRNMFAFLTGQVLVATKAQPTLFHIFVNIGSLLKEFEFTSPDGESFGDIPSVSFAWYMSHTSIADVRQSREKTLEALVMAERMRSKGLYREAFAHAVGKYAALQAAKSPVFDLISDRTKNMLELSNLDLMNRQHTLNNKLEQFEFPALFAGVASSNSASREVNFARWKAGFLRMRSFVLKYYQSSVGSWPPKASSKKNKFSESGLNRQVLKMLYRDFCALYDLLVDRGALSPRVKDAVTTEAHDKDHGRDDNDLEHDDNDGHDDAAAAAATDESRSVNVQYLRKILDEYDTSTPPVVPPIPFDIPLMPHMSSVYTNYSSMTAKDQLVFDRKLAHHELRLVLSKAYNIDTYRLGLPFLSEFQEFEAKEARGLASGKSLQEIVDQRIGYWLFLYAVIQTLPMLTVDAPDVVYADGVEYFLCQPPMGSLPWIDDASRKTWFEVAGGGVVELPAEAVKYSVEATYHQSHCWLAAEIWEEALNAGQVDGDMSSSLGGGGHPIASPLEPLPGFVEGDGGIGGGVTPPSAAGSAGTSPIMLPQTAAASTPRSGSPQFTVSAPRNQSSVPPSWVSSGGHPYRLNVSPGIELGTFPDYVGGEGGRRHVSSSDYHHLSSHDLPSWFNLPEALDGKPMRKSASYGNLDHLLLQQQYHHRHSLHPSLYGDVPRSGLLLAAESRADDGGGSGSNAAHAGGARPGAADKSTEQTFDSILGKVDRKEKKHKKWGFF